MSADFDWIFFDCFNTLIDDFDDSGDESGLGSIPELAAAHGFHASRAEFVADYRRQRGAAAAHGREMPLGERLRRTLAAHPTAAPAERIAATTGAMLEVWEKEYSRLLRPTPGVAAMLAHWGPRQPIGVVSNFFLPDRPAGYLRRFGLDANLAFVLDSAAFGWRKPNPAIFHEALRLAGLGGGDAGRVLFVGDRPDLDILPARALGFQLLHFNRRNTRPDVEPTPAGVPAIHDWAEFR